MNNKHSDFLRDPQHSTNNRTSTRRSVSRLTPFLTIPGLAFVIACLLAEDAHAYIDPSTGSYVLQMLLAGFLGALFALKVYWKRIISFFSRSSSKTEVNDSDDR